MSEPADEIIDSLVKITEYLESPEGAEQRGLIKRLMEWGCYNDACRVIRAVEQLQSLTQRLEAAESFLSWTSFTECLPESDALVVVEDSSGMLDVYKWTDKAYWRDDRLSRWIYLVDPDEAIQQSEGKADE